MLFMAATSLGVQLHVVVLSRGLRNGQPEWTLSTVPPDHARRFGVSFADFLERNEVQCCVTLAAAACSRDELGLAPNGLPTHGDGKNFDGKLRATEPDNGDDSGTSLRRVAQVWVGEWQNDK